MQTCQRIRGSTQETNSWEHKTASSQPSQDIVLIKNIMDKIKLCLLGIRQVTQRSTYRRALQRRRLYRKERIFYLWLGPFLQNQFKMETRDERREIGSVHISHELYLVSRLEDRSPILRKDSLGNCSLELANSLRLIMYSFADGHNKIIDKYQC